MSTSSATQTSSSSTQYSLADQQARFKRAKDENNQRYLDISTVYDVSSLKNKRIAVVGSNRGLGLEIAKQVAKIEGAQLVAITRSSSKDLEALEPAEFIQGIDQTDTSKTSSIAGQIKGGPIDVLINVAGFFQEEEETLENMDFDTQLKTIDICAVGPLRVSQALINAGLLKEGSKIIFITSQGGSVSWRFTQNPEGHDYGHHMSKAAANMAAVLLAQEVKSKGIAVGILHPGFNKTEMTAKYKEIWDIEGAVDPSVGAMRVLHETAKLNMDTTGKFINCEDGLEIPF